MAVDILVVVTAHNYARFLPECVESVLAQEGDIDWALVLVDDGSSDDTPQIVADYVARDCRIRGVRLEGVGLASAANVGIQSMDSDWVMRLDADDWLHPECLKSLLDAVESDNVDLAYPDFYLTDESGHVISRENRGKSLSGAGHERSPLAAACLYRRKAWETLGGYNTELRYQEDFEYWLKFIEQFAWTHVPEPLLYYRQHGISMSTNKKPRAATRQKVKQNAVKRLGRQPEVGEVPVFISTMSSLSRRIAPGTALMQLGGKSLLDLLLEKISHVQCCGNVTLVTAEEDVADWGRDNAIEVILSASHFSADRDIFAALEEYVPNQGVHLLVSPYFPLVESWRLQEVVDTLLLFGCRQVDTVIGEPAELLQMSDYGISRVSLEEADEMPAVYRQAGGFRSLCKRADPIRGGVEILPPEHLAVSGDIEFECIRHMMDMK